MASLTYLNTGKDIDKLSGPPLALSMDLDEDKIDAAALALLRLTLHDERRVWKGCDWDVLARLHEKGLISNPVGKARSVYLTDEGLETSAQLLEELFGRNQT